MENQTIRGKVTMLRRVTVSNKDFLEVKVVGDAGSLFVTFQPHPGNEPKLDEEIEVTLSSC